MKEVCFCGWGGEVSDRESVLVGGGELALSCPKCGHVDRLRWMSGDQRLDVLAEAAERRRPERRLAS